MFLCVFITTCRSEISLLYPTLYTSISRVTLCHLQHSTLDHTENQSVHCCYLLHHLLARIEEGVSRKISPIVSIDPCPPL